tara:strand:+ start:1108 stop:1431 length:324 start_codon:yes stop_codon:yes gene_type:complete
VTQESKKKVVFYDSTKRHADLRVKLQYDGMTQSDFFRTIVGGYLSDNPLIMEFIHSTREESNSGSNRQRKIWREETEGAESTKSQFALNEQEIEDIFDILEKEHPDL